MKYSSDFETRLKRFLAIVAPLSKVETYKNYDYPAFCIDNSFIVSFDEGKYFLQEILPIAGDYWTPPDEDYRDIVMSDDEDFAVLAERLAIGMARNAIECVYQSEEDLNDE